VRLPATIGLGFGLLGAIAAANAADCPGNPGALGTSRVMRIDPREYPLIGTVQYQDTLPLNDKEVVLTFDDGPWLGLTPAVLKALADQCTRALFFPIGKHATYYPEILKQVVEAGHTVGSHTWSHADLSRKSTEEAKEEIEKGISAVSMAVGPAASPIFRFPALRHPPEAVTHPGQRTVAIWSTDMDSFDFKMRKPEQVVASVMAKLKKHGKGIVLMHDFQQPTAHAVADLLAQLKAGGYKIVHMKTKDSIATIKQYDDMLIKEQKLPTVSQRPTSSVVRTVE